MSPAVEGQITHRLRLVEGVECGSGESRVVKPMFEDNGKLGVRHILFERCGLFVKDMLRIQSDIHYEKGHKTLL